MSAQYNKFTDPLISRNYRTLYICNTCGAKKSNIAIMSKDENKMEDRHRKQVKQPTRPKLMEKLNKFYLKNKLSTSNDMCHGDFGKVVLSTFKKNRATNTDAIKPPVPVNNEDHSYTMISSDDNLNEKQFEEDFKYGSLFHSRYLEGNIMSESVEFETEENEIPAIEQQKVTCDLTVEPHCKKNCSDKNDFMPFTPLDVTSDFVDVGYAIRDDKYGYNTAVESALDANATNNERQNFKKLLSTKLHIFKSNYLYDYDDSDNSDSMGINKPSKVGHLINLLNAIDVAEDWSNVYDRELEYIDNTNIRTEMFVKKPSTILEELSQKTASPKSSDFSIEPNQNLTHVSSVDLGNDLSSQEIN